MRVRVMTNFCMPNNGETLLADASCRSLARALPEADVKLLGYDHPCRLYRERAKVFRPYPGMPLFHLRRTVRFAADIRSLPVDRGFRPGWTYASALKSLREEAYEGLVVGSGPGVWRLARGVTEPRFPNLYWPPPDLPGVKIALGATAIGSDMKRVARHRDALRECLNGFSLVSVRDRFTLEMVRFMEPGPHVPVRLIPDPTFLEDFPDTDVLDELRRRGVDPERPMVGLAVHGKRPLCEAVAAHFRRQGFQVLGLSMYNAAADVNLGCVLGPYQWAHLIRLLGFFFTDRFHGTAFCLKGNTPFVSIDPCPPGEPLANKIVSLLEDWGMMDCYENVYDPRFRVEALIEKCDAVRAGWASGRQKHVAETGRARRQQGRAFVDEVGRALKSRQ